MARVSSEPPVTPTWRWRRIGETAPVWPGSPEQLGATWSPEATNFAVHAPEATDVWVCQFDDEGAEHRVQLTERQLGVWHGAVPGVAVGQRYGFRADGPWAPERGRLFNPAKLLLDPYARAISGHVTYDDSLFAHDTGDPERRSERDSAASTPRSVVVHDDFNWGDDAHAHHSWRDTVIYELHVKGFTAVHDRVPEELRGT